MSTNTKDPVVFISYSWHPTENKNKVINLAERLADKGVLVKLDVWDLAPGNDKNAFMEQMVTNLDVDHVLIICNEDYATKADGRKGGVGIESTIITGDIFNKDTKFQNKFLPIVFEKNSEGKAFVPAYAKSMTYIDLSDDDTFEEGFEQLLRTLYKAPSHPRPVLGNRPSFLSDESVTLSTANLVLDIEKQKKKNMSLDSIVKDYIEKFLSDIPNYRIDPLTFKGINGGISTSDIISSVENSINKMQPLKNDFLKFLKEIVNEEVFSLDLLIDIFERLLQTYSDNQISLLHGSSLQDMVNDNYKFFNQDLFISSIAILIDNEKYDTIYKLLTTTFNVVDHRNHGRVIPYNYLILRTYNESLAKKNELNRLNRVSVTADLIMQYATELKKEQLIQVDLYLYYMSCIYDMKSEYHYRDHWYPDLFCYSIYEPTFPKLVSKRYFNKICPLFNVTNEKDLRSLIDKSNEIEPSGLRSVPRIKYGLCYDNLCSID